MLINTVKWSTFHLFIVAFVGLFGERPASAACGGPGERGCCIGERKENNTKGPCDAGLVERGICEKELSKTNCHCGDNPKKLILSLGVCREKGTPIINRDPLTFPVQQCIHNAAGYAAEVRWFREGTVTFTRLAEDKFSISPTAPPFLTERIAGGQRSCVGGEGSKNWGVVTAKGGKFKRVLAIVAADIAAVAGSVGCFVGAAALTVSTAGAAGVVVGGACSIVTEKAIEMVVLDPGIIPDAKELFAVLNPPASGGQKPNWAILIGTVFNPGTRIGQP